ncbi:hypothetical protein VOLCADRAFT_95367 [Volvox carteri f. nagariensis]|uniref:Autophagy-related protein 13 N-terminal domain-containing protein n=1 Tax=Volvox carteri f. nagariensis TaxID=3068 RepID=D8U794_VOLCA|nr:uncharacterized protein VOLCADRAFT_95367 [Volvox carteri f. nagariensis]EFJ44383.1 hypothetical protein VOLCADRAFT_95367 [Volvox carteri f. nagariensis]|eukprot:XP_002954490.1 hypothetical protein VOLCADRAFT_95367 [Volvox carteri f. nagariensis]
MTVPAFLLELDEVDGVGKEVEVWRKDISSPLVIEIHMAPGGVAAALAAAAAASAAGPSGGGGSCLPAGGGGGGAAAVAAAADYFGSLAVQLRPGASRVQAIQDGQGSGGACQRSAGEQFQFQLQYRIYRTLQQAVGSDGGGALCGDGDTLPRPPPPRLQDFAFAPVDTPGGRFRVAVQYNPAATALVLEHSTAPMAMPYTLNENYLGPFGAAAAAAGGSLGPPAGSRGPYGTQPFPGTSAPSSAGMAAARHMRPAMSTSLSGPTTAVLMGRSPPADGGILRHAPSAGSFGVGGIVPGSGAAAASAAGGGGGGGGVPAAGGPAAPPRVIVRQSWSSKEMKVSFSLPPPLGSPGGLGGGGGGGVAGGFRRSSSVPVESSSVPTSAFAVPAWQHKMMAAVQGREEGGGGATAATAAMEVSGTATTGRSMAAAAPAGAEDSATAAAAAAGSSSSSAGGGSGVTSRVVDATAAATATGAVGDAAGVSPAVAGVSLYDEYDGSRGGEGDDAAAAGDRSSGGGSSGGGGTRQSTAAVLGVGGTGSGTASRTTSAPLAIPSRSSSRTRSVVDLRAPAVYGGFEHRMAPGSAPAAPRGMLGLALGAMKPGGARGSGIGGGGAAAAASPSISSDAAAEAAVTSGAADGGKADRAADASASLMSLASLHQAMVPLGYFAGHVAPPGAGGVGGGGGGVVGPARGVSGRDITYLATIRRPSWSSRSGSLDPSLASAGAAGPLMASLSPLRDLLESSYSNPSTPGGPRMRPDSADQPRRTSQRHRDPSSSSTSAIFSLSPSSSAVPGTSPAVHLHHLHHQHQRRGAAARAAATTAAAAEGSGAGGGGGGEGTGLAADSTDSAAAAAAAMRAGPGAAADSATTGAAGDRGAARGMGNGSAAAAAVAAENMDVAEPTEDVVPYDLYGTYGDPDVDARTCPLIREDSESDLLPFALDQEGLVLGPGAAGGGGPAAAMLTAAAAAAGARATAPTGGRPRVAGHPAAGPIELTLSIAQARERDVAVGAFVRMMADAAPLAAAPEHPAVREYSPREALLELQQLGNRIQAALEAAAPQLQMAAAAAAAAAPPPAPQPPQSYWGLAPPGGAGPCSFAASWCRRIRSHDRTRRLLGASVRLPLG